MTGNVIHGPHPDPARIPSFRAKQGDVFSSLPLLRKFGLRREKSLFAFADFIAALGWKRLRINLLVCSPLLLFAFSLSAQAPEPAPLAHGNIPGEPHHHLKIENDYVRAYYVEVPPHDATQLHQHDHDYIYVSLGPADVINAVLNKPEAHLALKDGETHFSRGGFAHVARNLADTPFRNVTIELLKPQGEPKNICAQVLFGAPLGDCPKSLTSASMRREPLLETAETSLDLVKLDPSLNVLNIRRTVLIVFLSETQIQSDSTGSPREKVSKGDALWVSAGSGELIWNSKSKDTSFLMLTFSGSESPATSK